MLEAPVFEMKTVSVSVVGRRGGQGDRLLSDVALSVEKGAMVGVVGVSGSGKSLLASAALGLLRTPPFDVSGSITLKGEELIGMSETQLRQRRGNAISLILSDARSRLNPLLPIGEQIIRAIREKRQVSHHAAEVEARRLIESVGIGDPDRRMNALPSELSGGMCQRVVIAVGICNEPSMIIADEPTSGLDVTIQMQVLKLIRDLVGRRETGMLLMTRDLGVVANFCDHAVVLQQGRVVESRPVHEFFAEPEHQHSRFLLAAAFASRGERARIAALEPANPSGDGRDG